MTNKETSDSAIAQMPRGGPNASWLDRQLQTTKLEYLDRDDVSDEIKQSVISGLDSIGNQTGEHEAIARAVLDLASAVPNPRILELGAGHGKLSARILDLHSTATVTISDLDPTSVSNIASSDLGTNPRVKTEVIDATAIDAPDNSYDLVVFAQAFHHLPPETALHAIAEATRVGKQFLVVDLARPSLPRFMLMAVVLPVVAAIAMIIRPKLRYLIHDGFISVLRSYSRSAFTALAHAADPGIEVKFLPWPKSGGPKPTAVVFSRTLG